MLISVKILSLSNPSWKYLIIAVYSFRPAWPWDRGRCRLQTCTIL